MKIFNEISKDMKTLIDISHQLGQLNESLLKHNNSLDRRNFNPELVEKKQEKINQLTEIYTNLYFKYF